MKSKKNSRSAVSEHRRATRADVGLSLKINKNERVIEAHTKNISSSGAYCTLDKFVPLNSTLDLTLLLPEKPEKGHPARKKVRCHGIVVRNQPEDADIVHPHYGIALFFTDIAKADRQRLSSFVREKLPVNARKGAAGAAGRYDPGRVFSARSFGAKGFSVSSANFKVLGQGINVSRNGICFQTDRSIPLFRELAVNLVLPPHPARAATKGHEALQCSAVVVGCERVPKTGKYDMAAYFVGLSREQKERLHHCIKKIF
ncbi:MAG: PilZ domain-containing protein [Chlamydiota bacterium]